MNNKGQALLAVIGILVIFMLFIPSLITMVQHEAKWTVKQKQSTNAFHAAEAGIDRGIWKLKESSANWDTLLNGGSIAGYTGNQEYALYPESNSSKVIGEYKVTLSSMPTPNQVLIRSVGHDPGNNQVRAIEVVFTSQNIPASLAVNGYLNWKANMDVQWGPVVSYDSISTCPNYYPRKIATGAIAGRCAVPTDPHSDGLEYWAFQDLGTPPEVDLAAYQSLAASSTVPSSVVNGAVATPAGSGYFGNTNITIKESLISSGTVIYTKGTARLNNGVFLDVKAVIAESDVTFKAKSSSVFIATVPVAASLEYQKVPLYNWPGKGLTHYPISDLGMHGFLYCGGNFDSAGGNAIICGSVYILGSMSFNTFTIYYDDKVAGDVKYTDIQMRQISWKEVPATWD